MWQTPPPAVALAGAMGRVYFSVFAGRRRFLTVLMAYVRPLVHDKTIDVVHLWDYCRSPPDREPKNR